MAETLVWRPAWQRVLIWLLATSAVSACGGGAAAKAPPHRVLRLTTGSPGAGFYPLGEALARAYRRALPGVEVKVLESPGSVTNMQAIQRGDADLGFAFADVAYLASVGRLAGQPFDRLRGVAVLQLNPLHLVVPADSGIRDVAELRGRRVGLGPPGSGTALTASLVLHAFGIEPDAIRGQFLGFSEASARLRHGDLDAMFVNASDPAASVGDATTTGARLLPIEGTPVDRLRHDYPFFRLTSIPPGTYPAVRVPVHTIGVDNVLVCRRDLAEEFVYQLTKQFFAQLPALAAEQVSLRQMDLDQVPATPIPLHEGAARYYREWELFR